MAAFTFNFPCGSSVDIAATQGDQSDSALQVNWGGEEGVVQISAVEPPSGSMAPQGIWFEATAVSGFSTSNADGLVYEPDLHEITYVWDFGDPGDFSAPENMPPQWRNRNAAYGPRVSHTFRDPGTYQITVTAFDRNNVRGTGTYTLVVEDPNVFYAGNRTICFSNSGDFTGAPAGCQQVTSRSALEAAIIGLPQKVGLANSYRLLFRRGEDVGEVYIGLNGARINDIGHFGNVSHIGAFGSGANPVLRAEGFKSVIRLGTFGVLKERFTVADLDFRGEWDPTTETGRSPDSPILYRDHQEPDMIYTVTNVNIRGSGIVEGTPGGGSVRVDGTAIWDDVSITDWRVFAFYVREMPENVRTRIALTGCRFVQNPDALNGGPRVALHNEHGCVRTEACSDLYIGGSDFFCRSGWSPLANSLADNPCLRPNSNGRRGAFINIERIVAEGGFQTVQLKKSNAGNTDSPINAILDRAILIATAKTLNNLGCSAGGTTIRNVYSYQPDVLPFHPNSDHAPLAFSEGTAPDPDNIANPVALYSSTAVNLRSPANTPFDALPWQFQEGLPDFDDYDLDSYTSHAPNLEVPVTPFAPISLSQPVPGVTTRYKGVLYNFEGIYPVLTAPVPVGDSILIPYTDITEKRADGRGPSTVTDQIYWLDVLATDTDHYILANGFHFADTGAIEVIAEPGGIRVVNNSPNTWQPGTWRLKLDRKSKLGPMNTAYDSSDQSVPIPLPVDPSEALEDDAEGFSTRMDILLNERADPPTRGAFEAGS